MVADKSNTETLVPSKSNSREHGPKILDSGAAKEESTLKKTTFSLRSRPQWVSSLPESCPNTIALLLEARSTFRRNAFSRLCPCYSEHKAGVLHNTKSAG